MGASAAYATFSDFPVAAGTDSSRELFVNGDSNWASDVSEAKNSSKGEEINGDFGIEAVRAKLMLDLQAAADKVSYV